jgi:hypothetical protein
MSTQSLTTSPPVWSSDTELVLDRIRVNAYNMSEVHRRRFLYLKGMANYFDIPVIILSAVNTIMSVGVQPYLSQGTISISTCVISAFSGIIVSIKLYLSIQSEMEIELSTCKEFYNLSVDIYKTISLDVPNRGVDGITYLNTCFQTYSDLVEKSSVLTKKLKDKMVPDQISFLPIPSHSPSVIDLPLNHVPTLSASLNVSTIDSTLPQLSTYDIEKGINIPTTEELSDNPIPPPLD